MRISKAISAMVCVGLMVSLALTGCSERKVHVDEPYELEHEFNEGDIYYQQNQDRGIPLNTENITDYLSNGDYYILHDGKLYSTFFSSKSGYNPGKLGLGDSSKKDRFLCFTSEDIKSIPTLFEGDKLYYFSRDAVYDYSCVERYIPWGWTVGIRNLQYTKTGHVYVRVPSKDDAEDEPATSPFFSPEFSDIYTHVDPENGGYVSIDKIGGLNLTADLVRDGMVDGLNEGAPYDFEMYQGTNYIYYHASADIFMFQGFESYALWEYEPLQDYLYEIKVPDYLLNGYYNFDGKGLIRLVRDTYWNEETDFSEKLLYSAYPPGDYSEEELAELATKEEDNMPRMYSDNEVLNSFKAYDETCFGYVDEDAEVETADANSDFRSELEQAYLEASTTVTAIWLPSGSASTISIITEEKTGKVYLKVNGDKRSIPYDRISGAYKLEITGHGEKGEIVVQGLYNDYTIKLSGCESYKNQDSAVTVQEEQPVTEDTSMAEEVSEEETSSEEPGENNEQP